MVSHTLRSKLALDEREDLGCLSRATTLHFEGAADQSRAHSVHIW